MPEEDGDLKQEPAPKIVTLRVEREYPEGVPLYYANHFTVQASVDEVFFSFFTMTPPDLAGDSVEIEKQRETLEKSGIKAKCVARVAMTQAFFQKVLKALKEHATRTGVSESPSDDKQEE